MQNARLYEAQARIKIAVRNINNLRYADDTTLMAESKEELNSLLMRVTEDEMVGWHHHLTGHEFEQTLGNSKGQGSLVCCSSWGYKESDIT